MSLVQERTGNDLAWYAARVARMEKIVHEEHMELRRIYTEAAQMQRQLDRDKARLEVERDFLEMAKEGWQS